MKACTILLVMGMVSLWGATNGMGPTYNRTGNGWISYCEGNCLSPVETPTYGGYIFMGGGLDVGAAFKQQIAWSGGGDFVVLRSDNDNGYNDWIYTTLGGVNSVTSLIVQTREAASDEHVLKTLLGAEAIFLAGGDQWQYYEFWEGTPIQGVLMARRGQVPIGGTSAGCMIQSPYYYPADDDHGVTSSEALMRPIQLRTTTWTGWINSSVLHPRVIIDTHFEQRDRFGRLLVFVARLIEEHGAPIYGIGISQHAALATDANGTAVLLGNHTAYIIYGTKPAYNLASNQPLNMPALSVQLLEPGDRFDLTTLTGGDPANLYQVGAVDGVLTKENPYGPGASSGSGSSSSSAN